MNLNKYMLFKNNELKEKKHSYLANPMNSYLSINDKYNLRKNTDNSYFQSIKNKSSNNNLNYTNQTTNNSYRITSNTSSINKDVKRHNYIIINNNNYKTLNKPMNIKKSPLSFYKDKNSKQTPLNNYIKISSINKINKNRNNNNNKNFKTFKSNEMINQSKNPFSNSNNYNPNIYDSEEIDYINMKLNFKLLEQKISHLNNIILPKDVDSSEYQNLTLNNKNFYKNIIQNASYFGRNELQKFHTDIYLNDNYDQTKLSQTNNIENLTNYILDKKSNEKSNYIYNLKKRQNKNLINRIHNSNYNIYKEHLAFQKDFEYLNNLQYKNGIENGEIKNNVIENKKELNDIYYNTMDNRNEIKPVKNFTKEAYSFNIPSKKFTKKFINNNLNEANNNIKNYSNNISSLSNNTFNINKSDNYKIINLSEIIYNAVNNANNKEKNFKTSDLVVQNVFSYNHHLDNISKIERKEIIDNSKDKEKFDETQKVLVNNDNKEIDENNKNDAKEENYDDESEKEGEKVIKSLLAQVTRNALNKDNIIIILNKEKNETKSFNNNDNTNYILSPNNKDDTDNSSNKNNININNEKKKKVTFDDQLIFINYSEKEKVTKLKIIKGNKTSQFKPKDISEYIKILTSHTTENKIKPILINAQKINYNNIVKKKKSIKSKQNQFLKKNIDYIKLVQKKGSNNSKEMSKKNKLKK